MKIAVAAALTCLLFTSNALAEDRPAKPGKVAKPPAAGKPALGGKRVTKVGGDSRAWSTLRPLLPESVSFAGQVNVSALRGSETFKHVKRIFEKDRDFKQAIEAARAGCQVEFGDAIQDVAFAVLGDDVAVAVSFKSMTEADVIRCVEVMRSKEKGKTVTIQARKLGSGNVVEYSVAGEPDKLFAAWPAPDVMVFVADADARDKLDKLLGGKGAFQSSPATRRALAAVSPGAAAWGVYLKGEHVGGYDLKLASAGLTVAGGQLSFDVSMFMGDADQAKRAAADWIAERDRMVTGGGGAPPFVGTLAKAVQIVATDDVVHVTASVSEKEFGGLFSLF